MVAANAAKPPMGMPSGLSRNRATGTFRVDGVADQINLPCNHVGCIQDRSNSCFAGDNGRFMSAPLCKQCSEREGSEGGSQHGDLCGEHTVCN